MVFTLEQNKFIIMSYYRNGIKRDGEWTYSVQACKEEFIAFDNHAYIYWVLAITK
jgi:hypothetical protein